MKAAFDVKSLVRPAILCSITWFAFYFLNQSIAQLGSSQEDYIVNYATYLLVAKWLIIGGILIHAILSGVINSSTSIK